MGIDDEFAAAAGVDYFPGKMPRQRPNIDDLRDNRTGRRHTMTKEIAGKAPNETLKLTQTAQRRQAVLTYRRRFDDFSPSVGSAC